MVREACREAYHRVAVTARSYDVSASHRDRDSEVRRLAAQARLGWDKEASALERLGFRDGMSILEPGSGPGFVTELMLEHFPAARVTAVEVDRELLNDAQRYLVKQREHVTFVHASVEETELSADAFDAAYARYLFQHLPDPARAVAEVFRLVRPGAPFVICDIDDALWGLSDPPTPGWDVVVERMAAAQAARGGNRYVGRRLLRLLGEAGFQDLDLEIIAKNTETYGLEAFLPQIDPGRLVPFVQLGVFSQQEVDDLLAKRDAFLNADRPFLLLLTFMAKGRKPI
jgi:ubiquinone/menaquinone biosynthesis C-methylase UbiE